MLKLTVYWYKTEVGITIVYIKVFFRNNKFSLGNIFLHVIWKIVLMHSEY